MKKQNYIAIKIEGLNGQQTLRCTAREDMELASPDGSKTIGISQGEVFYLAASDSLGEGWYYVVVMATDSGREGWRCQCSSCKPCKHERAVNASLRERFRIQTNREYEAYRESTLAAVKALGAMAQALAPVAAERYFARVATTPTPRMTDAEVDAWFKSLAKQEAKGDLNGSSQGFAVLK